MADKQQRVYCYIGSDEILNMTSKNSRRVRVRSSEDVLKWITETNQPREYDGTVIVTFIISEDGELWINDRRSEHVWCANGQNVLSAGEMTFEMDKNRVEVIEATNQSTGYCPEPESWWAVEQALDRAEIAHPTEFTTSFLFRRCDQCGSKNIVKDLWFECAVCQAPLSKDWNFD